jgi:hypothetical protein
VRVRHIRPLRALASLNALVTNLKQLTEVSRPDGSALPDLGDRWQELAESVSMEFGQLQTHLGFEAGNPGWTEDDGAGGNRPG